MTASPVWVIDSSAIIDCKTLVPARDQWALFEELKALVTGGHLFFPRQVTRELSNQRHIDTPEAWALNASGEIAHTYSPAPEFVAEVMLYAANVVEADAEDDAADPYVLAQALELRSKGYVPTIVTEDHLDHPPKIAMTTACGLIQPALHVIRLSDFLRAIGFVDS